MTSVNELKAQKYIETESKRHNEEVKKLRAENSRQLETEVKAGERELEKIKSDYEAKVSNLKNETEQKLVEIRDRQNRTMTEESQRMEQELQNLKKVHADQKGEIKVSQQNEIDSMVESHKKTVETARQKFLKEKNKFNS